MKVKSESEVTQSCPTLSYPMDCSLPGSSAHGISQARVLEWGAIAFSRRSYIQSTKIRPGANCGSDGKKKNLLAMLETQVRSLGWEDPLEKGMATHSIILAWGIPWTEEPGGLQSMGLQRVRHN